MRKLFLSLGIVLISVFTGTAAVKAGSLNAYEQEVVSAAKLTYEYEGVKYQVDQAFINQLIDYLSSEDIDLTAKQRDEVLQLAFANIEQGVKEGYLLPVEVQEEDQSTADGDTDEADSSTASGLDNPATGTDTMDSGSTSEGETSDPIADTPSKYPAVETGETISSKPEETINPEVVTPDKIIDQILKPEQDGLDKEEVSTSVEGTNPGTLDQNIIKNTGFDLTNTFMTGIALGVIMLVAIYVTIRFNLFAHNDE